jgi:hypothetical protein
MPVLIALGLIMVAAFMMVSVLVHLVRDLSRQSYLAPPDLDSSDDWDVEMGDSLRNSNALDDLRSAL